ncbi:MAG: AAA family ATPase [Candidatus Aminicenantes bacterium]|nr:AAA family ATPase [Candidatus Aminicenantes bacterium]NIM80948.1 AAA family ATPase [Candidatus Aminicenantes bacterium]NIN20330.1 AAA family ATPase [Candidatus Aminicenantes bacterium]NIN44105.1 AAA family ATPase [Candidatus Aminicenantes bacterium]NIN86918.1 AAA family ATPase [Candidatus Aminicenantes bacterium]
MRLKELYIKNFRGFKELEIKFPGSNLLVFVGINGAGKSSILDCIAMFLSQFVGELCRKSSRENEFPITENDINIDAEETSNKVTITIEEFLIDNTSENDFSWIIEKNRSPGKHKSKRRKPTLSDYTDQIYDKLNKQPGLNLPALAYYQNQKIILENHSKSKQKKYEFNQFYAYENAFKKGIHDFDDFITWFRLEEDWENEKKIEKGLDFVNKNLEVVRKALQTFLDKIPSADLSHLRVVRSKNNKVFRFDISHESSLVIEKTGKSLKIEQLSDGEKMLLLVVSDLARRLAIANPGLDDVLQGKGIVLIDEIDLHLHPQWQREVVPALRRTFPNCQFLVTTHSPQVLSNVEKENIFILENYNIVEETPFTFGKDSNSILYELMNVGERPALVKEELDNLYRLIDAEKIEEARTELKRLAEVLGENDKDIIRANMYIDFSST